MMRPVPRGTLALAGLAAGVVVGLGDGLLAGIGAQADLRGTVLAGLLAAAVDGLLGTAGGGLLEVVVRLAVWGRRARPHRWAESLAIVVFGGVVAALTVATALATADRRNRFLAGCLAALAAFGGGIVAAGLAPAVARGLGRGRAISVVPRGPDPALLLLAPLTVGVIGVVIMLATTVLRAPFASPSAIRRLAVVAVEAGVLPGLLLWAERLPTRLKFRSAAAIAAVLVGGPLVVFVARNWGNHLRFIPWTHVLPGAVIALVAVGNVPVIGSRLALSVWRRLVPLAIGIAVMILLVLVTSESETARKATAARAGFVGPVLAGARRALDWDGDGYARLLGGGDCDDGDPAVHPGILDLPDDGLDQDCDGRDVSVSILSPPPFAPVPDTVPRDLNLLLVTIDTIRSDHVGCYGYPRATTPAIDRLAADGALFINGWAHAPSTRYSMPAIATGRWPTAIAWDESIWWPRIGPGVRTIAEALKAEGYFTAAFYSYDYFSPSDRRGFERGVDLYRADRAVLHQAVNGPMESHGSSSREIADDAIAFLETHLGRKFFLWIHFYDPHLSYEPHADVPSFGRGRVDLYDGEIRFVDLHLGRVLERLRGLGLWNTTAIFVTGDHGEGFGEHGVSEHGFDLYAPQTKVPLVVRVPGLPARRITAPAGHVDLAPTLLNLARGRQEPGFLGRSLLAEMTGPAPGSAPVAPPPPVFQEVTSERGKKRALITPEWHVIWNWTPDNTTECYDRRVDPDERRDLWGRSDGAACRRLKADLQAMVSALSVPPDAGQKLRQNVFSTRAQAPVPGTAVAATIGDVVGVAGYDVVPGAVSPGGAVDLAIHFDCMKPVPAGWRLFFHMMGPGGSYRNLDHIPIDGLMPVERWRPGQRIVDRVRIPIAPGSPPGSYSVIIGLFRGGERFPIVPEALSDGKKALRLVTITVQ